MDRIIFLRDLTLVALGGAVGSAARFATTVAIGWMLPTVHFPWGILAVNVVGCFAIGALGEWIVPDAKLSPALRPLLLTGFLGGLTTFSALGNDTFRQLEAGHLAAALANVAANVVLGLVAVWLGVLLTRQLLG
jgi:CrcB protein